MTIDKFINLLVIITLVELMIAVGLSATPCNLLAVARNWRLWMKAMVANYVCVPAVTVCLLRVFNAQPMVVAGFLILAVCPGAPFVPPITAIAKGNVTTAVGLMVILAGSSAVVAPPLLRLLLPLVRVGETIDVDASQMVTTLLATQLGPLVLGLAARIWFPKIADRVQRPANVVSTILNLLTITVIVVSKFPMLLHTHPISFVRMFALLALCLAAGWFLGGPSTDNRRAMALATSLRNVGVCLVLATTSFRSPQVLTTVSAYAVVEVAGSLMLAFWWGSRQARPALV